MTGTTTISSGVTSVGASAFSGAAIENFVFKGTEPTIAAKGAPGQSLPSDARVYFERGPGKTWTTAGEYPNMTWQGYAATPIVVEIIGADIAYMGFDEPYTALYTGLDTPTITWSVDDTNFATIDPATGVLTPMAGGNVWITATASNGVSARRQVEIRTDFNYSITEDEVTIISYTNNSGSENLVIPDRIADKPVVAIDDAVFANVDFTGRGTLTLPSGLRTIGFDAFIRSSFIGSLTIPNTVTSIGASAFSGATFTGGLTLPTNSAFTSIPNNAFEQAAFVGDLVIPNSVTTIGNQAFSECAGFTGPLTLGSELLTIGENAFYDGNFTGALNLPSKLTSIGMNAFRGCTGFTGNLTLPANLDSIGAAAFAGCSGFTGNLTLPDNLDTLGRFAFQDCAGLTGALTLPDNATFTAIPNGAFSGCSGLTGTLTIPSGVTSIGTNALYNTAIEKLVFVSDAPTVMAKGAIDQSLPDGATVYYNPDKSFSMAVL